MNDRPSPTRWSSAFFGACMSIFVGCILLYVAVQLIEQIAVTLVVGTLVAITVPVRERRECLATAPWGQVGGQVCGQIPSM